VEDGPNRTPSEEQEAQGASRPGCGCLLGWLVVVLPKLFALYSRVFYRLKTEGLENVPREDVCVIVFNHHGLVSDALVSQAVTSRRAPGSLALFAGAAAAARFAGAGRQAAMLKVYRARGLSSLPLLQALEHLKEGTAVSLAPEGVISWDGRLKPLKPGAAWLALRANMPVVPVVCQGGYEVMPIWSRRPRLTGRITVRAGEPFYLSDRLPPGTIITRDMTEAGSRKISQALNELLMA